MKLFSLLVLTAVVSSNAFAAKCMTDAPRGAQWKECKNARANVMEDQYLLSTSGDFYTYAPGRGLCQVTSNVADFKASQHPQDAAVAYYEQGGDLYVLNETNNGGQCPKTAKHKIMSNVKKFTVTSNTNTTIVNVALSNGGELTAWDNSNVVYKDSGVVDFDMNQNFGAAGKPFSSFVMFSLDIGNKVTKVKGNASGSFFEYIKDSTAPGYFTSLSKFKQANTLR